MKTTGTSQAATGLWNSPNTGATNSSGFSGTPGGGRGFYADYFGIGNVGYWWSSSENGTGSSSGWYRDWDNNSVIVDRGSNVKQLGFSVRCLRD
jgi:uncharacterized protein (TIGR02145 family)